MVEAVKNPGMGAGAQGNPSACVQAGRSADRWGVPDRPTLGFSPAGVVVVDHFPIWTILADPMVW